MTSLFSAPQDTVEQAVALHVDQLFNPRCRLPDGPGLCLLSSPHDGRAADWGGR
jgi:hypothetical protein